MNHSFHPKNGQAIVGWTLTVVIIAALGFLGLKAKKFLLDPMVPASTDTFIVDVPPNSSFYAVRNTLEKEGLHIDPLSLKVWLKITNASQKLRVGEYQLQKNWSPYQILQGIISGKPLMRRFIVREGANIYDIKAEWAAIKPSWNQENIENILKSKTLLDKMEVPPPPLGLERTLEGFLFPETYSFQKYDSPRKIIEAMLEQFQQRALPLLKSHPWGQTAEGRYRLLTLASIVEKESGNVEEQPLVASVFWNRLTKRMKLQSDPTTIYGLLPNFDGNITKTHLLTPSPYNTYTLKELPVGPISNPGESAIKAVLNPATTDYLFFVSKNDGSHVFSSDYKTHDSYVNEFQRRRARQSKK